MFKFKGYFAPESLLRNEYSFKSDVWQAGCILYCMLCGHPAFHSDPQYQRQITHMTFYPMTGPEWAGISEPAKDLVRRMLSRNPDERFSTEEVLAHEWVSGSAPEIEFGPDYRRRVRALALKQRLKRFFLDNDIVSRCDAISVYFCMCT
jgi:serine/threonine protein kinase